MAEPAPPVEALRRFVVDRGSPVPLYFQVAQHLENAINSGSIPVGTLIQNEVDLAASMGLSRPTMRRAMQHLVDKGLVVRRRGIGTRVVQPKLRRPLELTSLYDDLASAGREPTTEVLSFSTSRPMPRSPSSSVSRKATRSSSWCGCAVPPTSRSPR